MRNYRIDKNEHLSFKDIYLALTKEYLWLSQQTESNRAEHIEGHAQLYCLLVKVKF